MFGLICLFRLFISILMILALIIMMWPGKVASSGLCVYPFLYLSIVFAFVHANYSGLRKSLVTIFLTGID